MVRVFQKYHAKSIYEEKQNLNTRETKPWNKRGGGDERENIQQEETRMTAPKTGTATHTPRASPQAIDSASFWG
jgi:hypothetical protein